jgi:transcriptional regulator with XRE-family HTH domain
MTILRRHTGREAEEGMITDPIDTHIGEVLRALRKQRGMNQSQLGAAGGVSYQQIQKYENGRSRIPASMLYKLAKALDTPIADFFPD